MDVDELPTLSDDEQRAYRKRVKHLQMEDSIKELTRGVIKDYARLMVTVALLGAGREVDLEDIFQDASGEISGGKFLKALRVERRIHRLTTLWNRLVAVRAAFPAKLKKKREATIPMNLINKKRRIEKKRNQSAARIQRTALKYVYTPRPGRAAPCATKALEF